MSGGEQQEENNQSVGNELDSVERLSVSLLANGETHTCREEVARAKGLKSKSTGMRSMVGDGMVGSSCP